MAKSVRKRCQTIVTLKGLKKKDAKTCLSLISGSAKEIDKVVEIKAIITCPMLLKKLRILIVETEISMSEDVTLGLLYYRIVFCLYTKHKTSKAIGKQLEEECKNYLIRLALENIWFRKPLTAKDFQAHFDAGFYLVNRHPHYVNIIF